MRASVGLPTHRVDLGEEVTTAAAVAEIARAAEQAGFDAVYVTDHPAPPEPWLAKGGHHTLDPLVTLAVAATATTRLRLQTNLYVAAYRHPQLAAKGVATLDALSGGRVILGVGAGYVEGEFAALGVDFERRNDLLDEALVAMKRAWSGDPVDGIVSLPRPVQQPHPPIWVGGNSKRAIRRAVEHGDGWVPMPSPDRSARFLHTPGLESVAALAERVAYARSHAESVDRTAPLEIAFAPAGMDGFHGTLPEPAAVIEACTELADVGVTYAVMTVPGESRRELLAGIERLGADVLPALAQL